MAVQKDDVLRWFGALHTIFSEQRQRLTEMDGAVGDGDFGISMDRGFSAVHTELSANPPADIKAVFQQIWEVLA